MTGEENFEEIKNSLDKIYIAYCKKDKITPINEWTTDKSSLDEKILDDIVRCIEFIVKSSLDDKTYIEEVSKGNIIEIEHTEPSQKRISIRTVLDKIVSFKKITDAMEREQIFKNSSKIIAMKYLKTTYSRSYALVIAPFTVFKEDFVVIFSSDIAEELKYPIIDSKHGLSVEVLSNALKGKVKGDRWIPLKIALYPAICHGERKDGFVKLYEEHRTLYWAGLFETLKMAPREKQREIAIKMLEATINKYGSIPDAAKNSVVKMSQEEDIVDLDNLARCLGIDKTKEYNNIKKDLLKKNILPSIKSEDLNINVKIEGRDFSLQVKLSYLLSREGNIQIFEHEGNIGILIKRIDGYNPTVKLSGSREPKIMNIRSLVGKIPTLRELVEEYK